MQEEKRVEQEIDAKEKHKTRDEQERIPKKKSKTRKNIFMLVIVLGTLLIGFVMFTSGSGVIHDVS